MLTVEIHGLRELQATLQALPRRLDRPLLNKSLMVGARTIRDEARRLAPLLKVENPHRVRGAIRRAINAGAVRPQGYTASVWVRVRPLTRRQIATFKKKTGKSAAENPNDPYYWWWVEFGTAKMAAHPFMRPAFEGRKTAAARDIINDLGPRIMAEAAKLR